MKRKIVLCFLLLMFFIACQTNKKAVKENFYFSQKQQEIFQPQFILVKQDTIKLPAIIKAQFVETDTGLLLVALDAKYNILHFFNFKTRWQSKINVFPSKKRKIIDFGFISNDTILFILNMMKNFGFADSVVLLTNFTLSQKKVFAIRNNKYFMTYDDYLTKSQDSTCVILDNVYEPFAYASKKVFLKISSNANFYGDSNFLNFPVLGYINLNTNDFNFLNLKLKDLFLQEGFLPYEYLLFNFLLSGDTIFISPPASNFVLLYNLKTQSFNKKIFKSTVIDTILAYKKKESMPNDYQFLNPVYTAFYYDKYKNLYYRLLRLPNFYNKTGKFLMIIYDKNFKFYAEGFVPAKQAPVLLFTKKYFITFKQLNDTIKIVKFWKVLFTKNSNVNLINQISKKSLKNKNTKFKKIKFEEYFKKIGIKKKNFTATVIFPETFCNSITNFVLLHYKMNNSKYEKLGVYLILVGDSQKLQQHIQADSILRTSKILKFDTTNLFLRYNNFRIEFYPRVFVVRNKKLKTDTIFTTQEGIQEDWQDFLIKSAKEQK